MDRHIEDNVKVVEMDFGQSRGSTKSRNGYLTNNHVERADQRYSPHHYTELKQNCLCHMLLAKMSPNACSRHFDDYFRVPKLLNLSEQVATNPVVAKELMTINSAQPASRLNGKRDEDQLSIGTWTGFVPSDQCYIVITMVFESREELIGWAGRIGKETGSIIVIKKFDHSSKEGHPELIDVVGCWYKILLLWTIQKAISYVYSSETVKIMLQEKKSVSSRPLNIAAEKESLRREMEVAESKRNKAEVERIQARLKELETISEQKRGLDTKVVRLAEMNKKKRAVNFKMASEKKAINTGLKEGEEGYDPFSRRWTRSRNYYVSNTIGGDEAAACANGDVVLESIRCSLKSHLDNFEAILRDSAKGYMGRKQRIEATIGRLKSRMMVRGTRSLRRLVT
ncbi:hypothetical protein IFM89_039437 [Coptis chinensis]|uniref:Uncharacterized protein n=1 Tax=Coptis chinensis TaxID=261450 RepID=A0A835LQS8_9MAGN|nr:hypothetical protein IFM89_039437 [Coptis chinensis]